MEAKEKEIRQKLKDNFEHYASKCLTIRTKSEGLQPFILNRAQKFIHEKLQAQKAATGMVRAIVLKGRQQGACFAENMKVLTADYRWLKIKEVAIGDRLVACDEELNTIKGKTKKSSRKFRTAIVQAKREFYRKTYEIIFDNGAVLDVTPEHRMLCKQRKGCMPQWRHVSDFQIGDEVRIVTRPPHYESDLEDGWMGGIIDGEGSHRGFTGAKRLSVHQTAGKVLERIRAYFNNIGIPCKEVIDKRTKCGQINKLGDKPVYRLDIHRLPYLMEIFSRCRPTRFTHDEWHVGHELPGKAAQNGIKPWAKIISIKPLSRKKVIDLQTSTKTYICEGLVSHNSTLISGRFFWQITHRKGCRAFILAHDIEATNNLFGMAQRFYDNCPLAVRPGVEKSNIKELIFSDGMDSGYKVGSAGNKFTGRSSTVQLLHGSECAFWDNAEEITKGLMNSVPREKGTEIILESTANGVNNFCHETWQASVSGKTEFMPIFIPWYWQTEYIADIPSDFIVADDEQELIDLYQLTPAQLMWRRIKMSEYGTRNAAKAFSQEYPCTAHEAFQTSGGETFIPPNLVMRARKTIVDGVGPLIIGVDPAGSGDDRTAIIRRRGRCAYNLQIFTKLESMEIVGILHKIIEKEHPTKMCIDSGSFGIGICDRLKELGHGDIIIPVNSATVALDQQLYVNKRAEMWGEMKLWLQDDPVQIPDSDELHADLCSYNYDENEHTDSKGRLKLERKALLKKRNIRSPDCGDCLAITFSVPRSMLRDYNKNEKDRKASTVMSQLARVQRVRDAGRQPRF